MSNVRLIGLHWDGMRIRSDVNPDGDSVESPLFSYEICTHLIVRMDKGSSSSSSVHKTACVKIVVLPIGITRKIELKIKITSLGSELGF